MANVKRVEKTVFISYRRENSPWALAIYQSLTQSGFDVFLDYQEIASGDFEHTILDNIKSRAHFLVVLTPSALKRCDDPGDTFRREIEEGLETRRNIVPLMLEAFDFSTPAIASKLTGKLAALKRYNGMTVSMEYFEAAMTKLREKFLNIPLDAVLHPASGLAQQAAKDQQAAAAAAPSVTQTELTAQDWFEQASNAVDFDEQIRCYTQAIRLKPNFDQAYALRGLSRLVNNDPEGALQDYTEALRLRPDNFNCHLLRATLFEAQGNIKDALQDYDEAVQLMPNQNAGYFGRAALRYQIGDLEGALHDYSEVIRLDPNGNDAYLRRAAVRNKIGDLEGARQDCTEVIRLAPDNMPAFYLRGLVRGLKDDLEGALEDFTEAIRLKPNENGGYCGRAMVRRAKGDLEGALKDYTEAIRLDPNDVALYNLRGLVHQAKGDCKSAQLDFAKSNPILDELTF